jgi:ribosomal protein S18 acetylase RimI-like enzyme
MKTEPMQLMIEAWKLMNSRLPSPQFEQANGIASCFCDMPNMMINLWFQSKPTISAIDFSKMLVSGKLRASNSKHIAGGIIRKDWSPSNWEELADQNELVSMVPLISMEADDLLPASRLQAKIDIRRVVDEAVASDLARLNADAYEMPFETFSDLSSMTFWQSDSYAYVGYADNQPVSCAAAFSVMNTVYVALVATAPHARAKGYAEAVMRHTVIQAQKAMKITRTTLHASLAGESLYKSMGYKSDAQLVLIGSAPE